MPKQISFPDGQPTSSTMSLISDAFQRVRKSRLITNRALLDDEKLPEQERIQVLQEVFHRNIREQELKQLAKLLSPAMAGETPPHLLIYGPAGAGKSVTCLHFLASLKQLCEARQEAFSYYYVDLTSPKTCFGALNEVAMALDASVRRYRKGIPQSLMHEIIVEKLREREGLVCLLVDEADNISVDVDAFFLFLAKTLPRLVPVRLCYCLLTNRLDWERNLDPRILSVLKKTDLVFAPYCSEDLVKILNLRVEKALDGSRVDPAAIQKIAAYASRETGDARKAVELLVKAAEVAEETTGRLMTAEVDTAQHTLEVDTSERLIKALAPQQLLALQACYLGIRRYARRLSTGTAYEVYRRLCTDTCNPVLTQRRFADLVALLDVYGLVNAPVYSKGRHGKTRLVSPTLPGQVVERLICGSEDPHGKLGA